MKLNKIHKNQNKISIGSPYLKLRCWQKFFCLALWEGIGICVLFWNSKYIWRLIRVLNLLQKKMLQFPPEKANAHGHGKFKKLRIYTLVRNGGIISMAWCKTAVTPLLTHWSYCNLALSHRFVVCSQPADRQHPARWCYAWGYNCLLTGGEGWRPWPSGQGLWRLRYSCLTQPRNQEDPCQAALWVQEGHPLR